MEQRSPILPYLRYTEDTSKNHPGGLKGKSVASKAVVQHANSGNASGIAHGPAGPAMAIPIFPTVTSQV